MSRVAVVTGAASGMGLAVGRRLAAAGHRVALLDLDGDAARRGRRRAARGRARRALGAAGRRHRPRRGRRRAGEGARRVRPDRDHGHERRASTSSSSFTDITVEAWERMLAVNLTGTFHCLQAAIPDMLAAGWGRIVTISSSSAQSGAARMAHYVASKGGVDRAHQGAGGRVRAARHHREHDPARLHRHADGAPRRGARRPPEHRRRRRPHAGPPRRHARRHRRRVRVPLLRGGGLHHRPAASASTAAGTCERRRARRASLRCPASSGTTTSAPRCAIAFSDGGRRRASSSTGPDALPDAERARHADAPPRARRPVPRLQQRAAASTRRSDAAHARADGPARRVADALDVRVGAARAPRGRRSASPPTRSTRSRTAPTPTAWTPLEADLLAATDQLIDRYRIDDDTWARLAEHLDERQLVELVFVVGTYTGLAMAFNSFGLQLDPDLQRLATASLPEFEE